MPKSKRLFPQNHRIIVLATGFVLFVLSASVVLPVVIDEFAINSHAHIQEIVEPLEHNEDRIAVLVSRAERGFLQYVINGSSEDLAEYESNVRALQSSLLEARTRAERLDAEALSKVRSITEAIERWQGLANSLIALRQEGKVVEAQIILATGTETQLVEDVQTRQEALHTYVTKVRETDRQRIDQYLDAQIKVGVGLGIMGLLAAITVAKLSTRTAHLYDQVRRERGRLAELARVERQRADELDAMIESMTEGLIVADPSGHVVRFSRTAREIWDVHQTKDDYPGFVDLASLDFRYPDDQPVPFADQPLNRALRGETFSGMEVVCVGPEGRRSHLLFSGSAVRDEDGKVMLGVTLFHDITAIRELERQREEFISIVAHDLRNPISVIVGYAKLLQRRSTCQRGLDLERSAVGLGHIASSAMRLERMVGDLLDASRIEANRLTLSREPVDLPRFLREIVERAGQTIEGHSVRFEAKGDALPVQADGQRLEQILMNLLSNAAKYSYPESEILIRMWPCEAGVTVSVTNNGEGILPEDQALIFDRFHRTKTASASLAPGLGLGLYIVKGLVEAHGGRIWVESEVGRYVTFYFTLPISKVAQAAVA